VRRRSPAATLVRREASITRLIVSEFVTLDGVMEAPGEWELSEVAIG
jgi:hypothetical protein